MPILATLITRSGATVNQYYYFTAVIDLLYISALPVADGRDHNSSGKRDIDTSARKWVHPSALLQHPPDRHPAGIIQRSRYDPPREQRLHAHGTLEYL